MKYDREVSFTLCDKENMNNLFHVNPSKWK